MSYEGFEEYICENGHLTSADAYDSIFRTYDDSSEEQDPLTCAQCKGKLKYYHAVNETNGVEQDNPSTFRASVKEISFTDLWHEDHYGNRYAIKQPLYAPDSPEWMQLRL